MAVRRRAVAGGDPLLEDAELGGAVERGGAHPGFHAGPPLFRRRVAGIDDLHGCAPLVGWAKARSDVPTIVIPGSMVGTPPAAFAPGRFAHPTSYNTLQTETNGMTEIKKVALVT